MNSDQRWKRNRRRHDRTWKHAKFFPRWGKDYTIHHDWMNGGVVYFLTPTEHDVLTRRGL